MFKTIFEKINKVLFLIKISKFNIFENKKNKKKNSLNKLKKILENKKIALVGNSPKLLKKKNNIDDFDVVIRINLLPLKKHKKYVGERCDIMMMSSGTTKLIDENYIKVYFSDKNSYIAKYGKGEIYTFPLKYHKYLTKKINARPTSGLMSIYLLTKLIKYPKITLFGFDHTHTSWHANEFGTNISSSRHNLISEKKLFLDFCKKYKGINYSNL